MPIHLPPGVDRTFLEPLTEVVQHRGEWVPAYEVDGAYRRMITRASPALFALVYLPRHLKSRLTGGRTSFSRMHLDLCRLAGRWTRAGAHRDGIVGPRFGAKSTWSLVNLPMWAGAHGHRFFALGYADSTEQIRLHMGTFRTALDANPWILADFPDLAPWPGMARGRQDNATTYTARGGFTYAARGIRASTQGMKSPTNERPDLIGLDDIEPGEHKYSAKLRQQRLDTMLHEILPANEQAAVVLTGTTTMYGSIMHALVRAAAGERPEPWIVDEGFRARHYPAIVVDPVTGEESSFWPQRFSLEYLRSIAHTRNYLLNYANTPPMPGGHQFTEATFLRGADPVRDLVLFIDPAPTVGPDSDYSAFVIGGLTDPDQLGRRRVQLEYARAWKLTGAGIRERARELCRRNPRIRAVYLERNVAADWAHGVLEPERDGVRERLAPGVRVFTYRSHGSKDGRIATMLDEYESELVQHAGTLTAYEQQAQRWGDTSLPNDDLIDAGAALVSFLLHPELTDARAA